MDWPTIPKIKKQQKLKLKEIVFDPPIKDGRWNMNSKLYLRISGEKGSERKITLRDQNQDPLQERYFSNGEDNQELYLRTEKLLQKYHKGENSYQNVQKLFKKYFGGENPSLPSDVLSELFP